ncbi:hypothetical protein HJFPF1_09178 [Paramyrothecium foliicola]|nr:hypothetical protein HJFPF1_09178 [Paramyrothecium foliicola]
MPRRASAPVPSRRSGGHSIDSSEEDEASISPTRSRTGTTAGLRRSSRHTRSTTSLKRKKSLDGGLGVLPAKRPQKGLLEPRRRQTLKDNATEKDPNGEDDDDDNEDEVPVNPAFYDNINKSAVFQGVPRSQKTPKMSPNHHRLSEHVINTQRTVFTHDIYEIQESEPEAENDNQEVRSQLDSQLPDGHRQPHIERDESPLFVEQERPSDQHYLRKSRNAPKIPYGSTGYRRPRGGSEELGSDIAMAPTRKSQTTIVQPESSKGASKEAIDQVAIETTQSNFETNDGRDELQDEEEADDVGNPANLSTTRGDKDGPVANTPYERTYESRPDQSMVVGEDSLQFDAPGETTEPFMVKLSSENLMKMLSKLGARAWTNEGTKWHSEFLSLNPNETKPQWLRRHTKGFKAEICKTLLSFLHYLWEICHHMPRAPHSDEQMTHMMTNEDGIRKSLRTIRVCIEKISSKYLSQVEESQHTASRSEWVADVLSRLRRKIIPMLVLLIREVFLTGCEEPSETEPTLDRQGEFTHPALELLLRMVGWTLRLNEIVGMDFQLYPPRPATDARAEMKKMDTEAKDRFEFTAQLTSFKGCLDTAVDNLDELMNGPQRRLEAMEKDRQAKMERERKETEQLMTENRQMQMFIASTQKTSTLVVSSQDSHDEYYEKHGFYFWEDEQLLKLIRQVPDPNYRVLASTFVNRSHRELRYRADELKGFVREKYEAANLVPPLWCYS